MDPFSVTAGVAGLLSLTLQLTERLTEYGSSVRHAATESHDLAVQLTALFTVLQRLQRWLRNQRGKGATFDTTSLLCTTTGSCHTKLSSLDKTLQQFMNRTHSPSKLWKRCVMWPLQKSEQQQLVSNIHQWIQIFSYSLTIEGCSILSASQESLADIRLSQATSSQEIIRLAGGLNTISESLYQSNQVTQSSLDSLHAARVAEERLEILKWLSPIDPSVNLNASLRVRQPNTGLWFLESEAFAQWIKSPNTLWLHGIPGCGKTVLCSTIIEAIEEVCSQCDAQQIAYFFFDFQNSDKHDSSFMMCSLIRQLSAVELEIPEAARAMYLKCHATGHSPTLEELIATFTSVVCASSRDTFIILDALDEVPSGLQRRETLDLMKRLTSVASDKLRLLVTSRDESDIRHVLGEIADKVIQLQNEDMGIDIKAFVRARLESARFVKLPTKTRNKIEERVGNGAHGMFRWASCQMDMLEQCRKVGDIKIALTRLPDTLDETYARMLSSVPANEFEDLLSIFQWLACSQRPLTLQEVAEAAVGRPSYPPLDPDDKLFDASESLRLCRGLVSISKEYVHEYGKICEVVRFVHFSVKEYLLSGRATSFAISLSSSHSYVGNCCISNFLPWIGSSAFQRSLSESQLLQYGAKYWPTHVEDARDGDSKLLDRVFELFSPKHSQDFLTWLQIYDPLMIDTTDVGSLNQNTFPSPLFYATLLGLRDCTLRLLKAGEDVNVRHPVHGTPLCKASELDHFDIVQMLLHHGATIDEFGTSNHVPYGTALEVAAVRGNLRTVKLLLSKGADPNAPSRYGSILHTTLSSASTPDKTTQIALCLIRAGAGIHSIYSNSHPSALGIASLRGLDLVVEELVRNVAILSFEGPTQRANSRGSRGLKQIHFKRDERMGRGLESNLSDSALLIENHQFTTIRLLQDTILHPTSLRMSNGLAEWTIKRPLRLATIRVFEDICNESNRVSRNPDNQHERVFLVILNYGTNPHYSNNHSVPMRDKVGNPVCRYRRVHIVQWQTRQSWSTNSSLQPAPEINVPDIVKLLIAASQDLEAQNTSADSALQLALRRGYVPSFQSLLDSGLNFHEINEESGSPLQRASSTGNEGMTNLLLESGLSPDIAVGNSFGTALQEASSLKYKGIVKILLDAGVDVNKPGLRPRQTALQEAIKHGHKDIMEILLNAGATARATLPEASRRGSIDIVRHLLDSDADPNARDSATGKTALQEASARGQFDIVSLLIDRGADVNAPGVRNVGGTALQEASSEGCLQVVQLLLNSGADVNAEGISGWCGTALQEAAHAEQVEVAKLLIQFGADASAPAGFWGNAVEAAASAGCNDAIEILLEAGAAVGDALRIAVKEENTDTARLLLQSRGAKSTHHEGRTVLHEAVDNSDLETAKLLLENGVSVNSAAALDYPTPLQLAILVGNCDMVELLIERGADLNIAKGYHWITLLQKSLSGGSEKMGEALLREGVDICSPHFWS